MASFLEGRVSAIRIDGGGGSEEDDVEITKGSRVDGARDGSRRRRSCVLSGVSSEQKSQTASDRVIQVM